MPNVHLNVAKWREALTKKDFPRRDSTFAWPGLRKEDDESENDSSTEESTGWSRGCRVLCFNCCRLVIYCRDLVTEWLRTI